MIRYALVFAILALISGLLGYVGLENNLAFVAKVFAMVFVLLFVVSLIFGRHSIQSAI